MGVIIHILERRTAQLEVAGSAQEAGILRQVCKLTELDSRRSAELEEAKRIPSPAAAMVALAVDLPLASTPGICAAAHPVIGWDEGRGSVVDLGWDYLPLLGYAVRDADSGVFVLHELRDGLLHRFDRKRAAETGLLADGKLSRRGQPQIRECHEVRPYVTGFAEADCFLQDGRRETLVVRVYGDTLPDPSWLVGRRPMDIQQYVPDQAASAGIPG